MGHRDGTQIRLRIRRDEIVGVSDNYVRREVLPFWIVWAGTFIYSVFRHGRIVGSGTCLHPAGVGGSQFTMTLWMEYVQTPEIENGNHSHCHFSWFGTIPCTGSW